MTKAATKPQRSSIETRIREILTGDLCVPEEEITGNGLQIPDSDYDDLETVQQWVAFVEKKTHV